MKAISLFILIFCLTQLYSQQDTIESFKIAEWPPVFKDDSSLENWYDYLKTEIDKSEYSNHDSISGRVVVGFIIDSIGRVIDPWIERGLKPNYDEEAIRIVSSSPQWKPANHKGQNVEVVMYSPIDFNVSEEVGEPSNHNRRRNKKEKNYR